MDNKENKVTVSKGSLILRVLVSGYLLYTDYELISSFGTATGNDRIIVVIAIIVFALVAIPLGFVSIKALSEGKYKRPVESAEESAGESEETPQPPETAQIATESDKEVQAGEAETEETKDI